MAVFPPGRVLRGKERTGHGVNKFKGSQRSDQFNSMPYALCPMLLQVPDRQCAVTAFMRLAHGIVVEVVEIKNP